MAEPTVNNSKTVYGNWQSGVEEITAKGLPADKFKAELEKLKGQILSIARDNLGYSVDEANNAKANLEDALTIAKRFNRDLQLRQKKVTAAEAACKAGQMRWSEGVRRDDPRASDYKAAYDKLLRELDVAKVELAAVTRDEAYARIESEVAKALVDEMTRSPAARTIFGIDAEPLRKTKTNEW